MKAKRKIGLGLVFFIIIGILIVGFLQTGQKPEQYQAKEFLMDTIVSIKANGEGADKAVQNVIKMMREVAKKSNRYNEDSIVSEINRQAGVKPVKVDKDIMAMIKTAKEYSKLTEGKFDITIAPIIELWGFGTDNKRVPASKVVKDKLRLVSYKDIIIDEDKQTIMLAEAGMKIDLGGIAKGYIVDKAANLLKKQGIKSALINAGGNIRTIGTKYNGEKWRLGIRNPRDNKEDPNDNYFKIIEVKEANVVTSGDYERYFMEDGKRYHHILDPKTGYPSRGLASVTIISDSSLKGDILSTALFILGFDKAKNYIEEHSEVEGMLVTTAEQEWKSKGFKELLTD